MNVQLINPRSCRGCEHASPSNMAADHFECREGPPTTVLIVQPSMTGPQIQGFLTSPPIVNGNATCSRWKRRIERAVDAPIAAAAVNGNPA